MEQKLSPKKVLITSPLNGLGYQLAINLLKSGFIVIITGKKLTNVYETVRKII